MPAAGAEEEFIENLGLGCDGNAEPHYAAKFNAETMLNFLDHLLEQYGQSVDKLLVGLVADNTEVNRKMTKDANLPHLPCHNHTLELDVLELDKSHSAISLHHSAIRDILGKVKQSTVEYGILGQLTNIKCTTTKTFKWTAKFQVCSRFEKLWPALSAMTSMDRSKVEFDTSLNFRNANKQYSSQLNAISQLHGKLQMHGLPRYKGQQMIDKTAQVMMQTS